MRVTRCAVGGALALGVLMVVAGCGKPMVTFGNGGSRTSPASAGATTAPSTPAGTPAPTEPTIYTSLPEPGRTVTVTRSAPIRPTVPTAPTSSVPTSAPSRVIVDNDGHDTTGWASPSGNIVCGLSGNPNLSDGQVRCDVTENTWRLPPRPTDCPGSWGHSVSLSGGRTQLVCAGDTVSGAAALGQDGVWWHRSSDPTVSAFGQRLAVLPYGWSIRAGVVTCTSSAAGMSCVDGDNGRGFSVSKAAYALS